MHTGEEDHAWPGWTTSRGGHSRGRVYQNDRDKWRKYVHGGPTLGSRTVKEQNSRTVDSNNICLKVNRSARVQRMNNVSGATLATETAV